MRPKRFSFESPQPSVVTLNAALNGESRVIDELHWIWRTRLSQLVDFVSEAKRAQRGLYVQSKNEIVFPEGPFPRNARARTGFLTRMAEAASDIARMGTARGPIWVLDMKKVPKEWMTGLRPSGIFHAPMELDEDPFVRSCFQDHERPLEGRVDRSINKTHDSVLGVIRGSSSLPHTDTRLIRGASILLERMAHQDLVLEIVNSTG